MDGGTVLNKIRAGEAKVAVLGLGHAGLPTALGLAELGWYITAADSNPGVVRVLKAGHCPFYEPGLQGLLSKHIVSPTFALTDDIEVAIRSGSILFICVGTPQREDGAADVAQLEALIRMTARNLNGYEAAQGAHVLLLLTEWEEFGQVDLRRVRESMEAPVLVEGRNFYNRNHMREVGLEYLCMGRKGVEDGVASSLD